MNQRNHAVNEVTTAPDHANDEGAAIAAYLASLHPAPDALRPDHVRIRIPTAERGRYRRKMDTARQLVPIAHP